MKAVRNFTNLPAVIVKPALVLGNSADVISDTDQSITKCPANSVDISAIADKICRRVVNTAQSEDEIRRIIAQLAAGLETISSHIGNTWQMTASIWRMMANVWSSLTNVCC